MATQRKSIVLDDTSKAIIERLQRDGRQSYAEIAREVGLSEAAVRQRVQRLTESGVIQIVAVTDPIQLGFSSQAMIGVHVDGDTRSVAAAIADLPQVDYCVMTAGRFDLLVEVICEDDDALVDLIGSTIRQVDSVSGTETFVYLGLVKQLYDWGTR